MNNIRWRITVLTLISIIIVSLVIGYTTSSRTNETFESDVYEMLTTKAINQSIIFDQELIDVEETAKALEILVEALFDVEAYNSNHAYLYDFKTLIAPTIKRLAEETSQSNSAYVYFSPELDSVSHDVWFTDLDKSGKVIRQPEISKTFYDEITEQKDWFFVPRRTLEPHWTDPYPGNYDFNADIVFISHTRAVVKDDLFVGVIGSDYYYSDLLRDIDDINLYETGYAVMLNQDIEMMTEPKDEWVGVFDFWDKQKLKYNANGVLELSDERLFFYNKLRNDWVFGLVVNKREIFMWHQDLIRVLIGSTLVLFLIVLVYSRYVSILIMSPFELLTKKVKYIKSGNYNDPISSKLLLKNDETGILSRSIEKMRLKQKMTLDEIVEQNETLELKIEERTQSLQESHEFLEKSVQDNIDKNDELLTLNVALEAAIKNMNDTEKLLIESEKSASLSLIVVKMAHEFNTPLGSFLTILTYVNQKKEKVQMQLNKGELSKTELISFLKLYDESQILITESLDTIRKLIQRFKSIDPYAVMSIETTINLKSFLELIVDGLSFKDSLTIKVNCPENLILILDAGKLSQIILHIIENAYLHAYDSGSGLVEVEVKYHDMLELTITDYGKGISNQMINDIFVPYSSEYLNTKHSNLGLNVVYNLVVQVFHGHISCESVVNKKTTFTIIINPKLKE